MCNWSGSGQGNKSQIKCDSNHTLSTYFIIEYGFLIKKFMMIKPWFLTKIKASWVREEGRNSQKKCDVNHTF